MNTLQRRVLVGSAFARLAPEGVPLALVMLAIDRTGSVGRAGSLTAVSTLPQLVTGPIVGSRLDRSHRPMRAIAGAALAASAALVVLALDTGLGGASYAASMAVAVASPALVGALSASFARLAPAAEISKVAAWDSIGYNIAGLGAPAIVTVAAVSVDGPTAVLLLAACTLVAVPVLLHGPDIGSCRPAAPAERSPSRRTIVGDIAEAFRLILSVRPLRAVTVTTTLSFFAFGALPIAAAAAAEATGRDGESGGQLITGIAVGALTGSLVWARARPAAAPDRTVVVAVGVSGLIAVAFGAVPWPVVLIGAGLLGVLDAPTLIGTFATRTRYSPDDRRTVVFTVGASLKLAASAIGALTAGVLLDGRATFGGLVVVGVVMAGAGLLGWLSGRPFTAN